MSATIDDVAARAGVSTATVSRALRGLPHVSAGARARVLQAAAELDYVAAPTASRLATGRTGAVAVVTAYLGTWFFGQVLSGIERVLRAAEYDVLLNALPDADAQDEFLSRMPLRRRVDGVVLLAVTLTPAQQEAMVSLDLPMVAVGDPLAQSFSVGIDNEAAARTATNHLINLGHRRIAMIGDSGARFSTPGQRRRGFLGAMRAAGLEVPGGYLVEGGYTVSGGASAMAELLSLPQPPSAVFAQSDEMAAGAMQAIRRIGLRCPDDVSIVGFDDHELAAVLDLTTMAQPAQLRGEIAAEHLLEALAEARTATGSGRELAHTRLVVRSSTGPPA